MRLDVQFVGCKALKLPKCICTSIEINTFHIFFSAKYNETRTWFNLYCMYVCMCVYVYVCIHSEQKFKRNTFVFAPFFHGLNSKI